MRKLLYGFYLKIIFWELFLRRLVFGFENLNNRVQGIEKRLIVEILTKFGARIGTNVEIESPIIINAKNNYSNLSIGDNTYIGKDVLLDLKGKVSIGANTTVSMRSVILGHIDLGKKCELKAFYPTEYSGCKIGNHCYIGANSTIIPAIEINDYALVAAGSVVTKNVPEYTMVAGVPANHMKKIGIF